MHFFQNSYKRFNCILSNFSEKNKTMFIPLKFARRWHSTINSFFNYSNIFQNFVTCLGEIPDCNGRWMLQVTGYRCLAIRVFALKKLISLKLYTTYKQHIIYQIILVTMTMIIKVLAVNIIVIVHVLVIIDNI